MSEKPIWKPVLDPPPFYETYPFVKINPSGDFMWFRVRSNRSGKSILVHLSTAEAETLGQQLIFCASENKRIQKLRQEHPE